MADKKKELKKAYLQNHPPMGIYQIRNLANGKVFVGSSPNLPGALNSNKFQLSAGSHRNKTLQREWSELGEDKFAFEILDELSAIEGAGKDYRPDLVVLEDFWLDKIKPYGDRGYNEKKKGTEERLKIIAQNRLSNE